MKDGEREKRRSVMSDGGGWAGGKQWWAENLKTDRRYGRRD